MFVHHTGIGVDDDHRVGAARHEHEEFKNMTVVFLVFGAADRHDPAATLALGNFTWHSAAPPRARKFLCAAARTTLSRSRTSRRIMTVCGRSVAGNTAQSAKPSPMIQGLMAG